MLQKYEDFLLESKLDLLLEANIQYSKVFKEILSDVPSPVSKSILSLSSKEVNVNTNFIDVDLEKDDTVNFLPDNRIKNFKVIEPGETYTSFILNIKDGVIGRDGSNLFTKEKELITKSHYFNEGDEVELLSIISLEELNKFNSGFSEPLYLVGNNNGQAFMNIRGLKPIGVTPTDVKIGRFARRLLSSAGVNQFNDSEIEDFVNKFKSAISRLKNAFDRVKIVSGDDIIKYYNLNQYSSQSGSLGGSCMRYEKCSRYLRIYSENPNQVELVVLFNDEESDLIRARAILWTDTKGRKLMDRIYGTVDSDVQILKDWAIQNGIYYKKLQNFYEDTPFMLGDDLLEDHVEVKLEKWEFRYYPYLDTLKFFDYNNGILTNNSDKLRSDYWTLTDTEGGNGSCSTCGGSGRQDCEECDGEGEVTCGRCDGDCDELCEECDGNGDRECRNCDGEGTVELSDGETEECEECSGRGLVDCGECEGTGRITCMRCDGDGSQRCRNCDGDGWVDCWDCQ